MELSVQPAIEIGLMLWTGAFEADAGLPMPIIPNHRANRSDR